MSEQLELNLKRKNRLEELKEAYKIALQKENYDFIDQVITYCFWSLIRVRKAFEKYIGSESNPRRINPNIHDTPTYHLMKPSEQGNVEAMFMDDVLTGKRKI